MRNMVILAAAAFSAMLPSAGAKADPVPLSAYVDANGFLDVQTLTCAQLANTYQHLDSGAKCNGS